MMDKGKGKSEEIESVLNIEDWVKELFPDSTEDTADIGTRKSGISIRSSTPNNSNQQNTVINLEDQDYQVSAMTFSSINPGMRQNLSCISDSSNSSSCQSASNYFSPTYNDFSQNRSNNSISNVQQVNAYTTSRRQQQPTQTLFGYQSINPLIARNQNVLQHNNQSSEAQIGLLLESINPALPIRRPQNRTFVDQVKQENQSQTMIFGSSQASFDSVPQDQSTNFTDWVTQIFQQIQTMKPIYMGEALSLRARAIEQRQKATSVENINKCERHRHFAEKAIRLLNLSPSALVNCRKETIQRAMGDIVRCFRHYRGGKSLLMNQMPPQQGGSTNHLQPPQQGEPSTNHFQPPQQGGSTNHLQPPQQGEPSANHFQPPQMQQRGKNFIQINSEQQGSSQKGFDQNALRMLLQPTNSGVQNHTVNSSKIIFNPFDHSSTVNSSKIIFNPFDHSPSSINRPSSIDALTSALTSHQQNKPRDSIQRQPIMHEKRQQLMLQKPKENTNFRQFFGLNQKHHVNSPQNSQNSTSWKSVPVFPLTPLTTSSASADIGTSPLSVEETSKITNKDSTAPVNLSLEDSDLQTESQDPGEKQSSPDKETPIQRLVKAVKNMSPKVLQSAIRDIEAVVNINDKIPTSFLPDEPTRFVIHDLADDISTFRIGESRMKRKLIATAYNDFSTSQMEFNASDGMKKLKNEINDVLMQEIKEINHKLIEVVVDVKEVYGVGDDQKTVLKCSYKPVSFSSINKMPNTSEETFPHLVLEFIVSADYPNSCPTVVEVQPPVCSETDDGKCLWTKAKEKFDLSLRKYSEKITVKQMAETWNACAAEVYLEFAEKLGGGSFSSKYGKWETFVVAN